jgi:hypothetical protein
MRNLLLCSSLLLLLTGPAVAQQGFPTLEIVIEGAGLTQTFSGVPDGITTDAEWGAQAGASLRIGRQFYVEPGLSMAGAAYTIIADVDGFEEEDVLGHLGVRVPVLVGVRVLKASTLNLRFFAGLAPLFITQVEEDNDLEVDEDDYNSTVWNATFGGGVDFLFITAGLFYEAGLNSLFVVGEESVSDDIKLSGLGARLGIRIAF